jgi:hypothetical protein
MAHLVLNDDGNDNDNDGDDDQTRRNETEIKGTAVDTA